MVTMTRQWRMLKAWTTTQATTVEAAVVVPVRMQLAGTSEKKGKDRGKAEQTAAERKLGTYVDIFIAGIMSFVRASCRMSRPALQNMISIARLV